MLLVAWKMEIAVVVMIDFKSNLMFLWSKKKKEVKGKEGGGG